MQGGQVARAPAVRGFKSPTDNLAGIASRFTLVELLSHACKWPAGLPPGSWGFKPAMFSTYTCICFFQFEWYASEPARCGYKRTDRQTRIL